MTTPRFPIPPPLEVIGTVKRHVEVEFVARCIWGDAWTTHDTKAEALRWLEDHHNNSHEGGNP